MREACHGFFSTLAFGLLIGAREFMGRWGLRAWSQRRV